MKQQPDIEILFQIQLDQELQNEIRETLGRLMGISRVIVLERITRGRSKAQVLIVDITSRDSKGPVGLHILKFDSCHNTAKEIEGYRSAQRTCMVKQIPQLVAQTSLEKPFENAIVLYSLAHGTLRNATTLLNLIDMSVSYTSKQIAALTEIFKEAFDSYTVESFYAYDLIVKELGSLLKGGKSVQRVAEDDLGIRPDQGLLMFEGDRQVWPNPIAYIHEKSMWEGSRALCWPVQCGHGDLHGENIICPKPGFSEQQPILIDFVNFRQATSLFYDFLYLELALLLRILPLDTDKEREQCLQIGEVFDQEVILREEEYPGGPGVFSACKLIAPMRQVIGEFIQQSGRSEDFETVFWLTGMIVALNYFRKLYDKPFARKFALLIAARRLAVLLDQLGIDYSKHGQICYIEWSSASSAQASQQSQANTC